ncbi:hypothetical protein ACPPVO_36120 [Dactylosporangium sp. McL0621]|uniref:hypothetical protein n=1 Tax=Dactylosporangium sp. McL0621 TaxID=3415678 RepID=UPI003CF8A20C
MAAASLIIVGAVKGCTISVMPKDDETNDILTDYDQPFEITGTGEVINGTSTFTCRPAAKDEPWSDTCTARLCRTGSSGPT